MKKLIYVVACAMLMTGCAAPKTGVYVGGEDRCYISSQWGCHMYVKNGFTTDGVGVNLRMVGGQIGSGKPPSIANDM